MPLLNKTGRHDVTVKSARIGESENGNPFVQFAFETDAEEAITGWLYLSEKAFENSVQTLREAFNFNGDFETIEAQAVGKRCNITVESEEYQGKQRYKVKWINRLAAPVKALSGGTDKIKQLSALAARVPAKAPKAPSGAKPASKTAASDFPS